MRATSAPQPTSTTFADRFGMAGVSSVAREVTATLIGARVKGIGHRAPRDKSIVNLRSDIRNGKILPIRALLRLAFTDIDDGVSVQLVTQYLRELIERVEQYAERRQRRQSSGLLPFRQRITRQAVRGQREECEAHIAILEVAEDVATIDKAIEELNEEIAEDQNTVALLTAEKIRLEGGA